jgi:photosystem II stability/assembly factor-like uncharacterized protein
MKRKLLLMAALVAGTIGANAQMAWNVQNSMFTAASRGINDFNVVDSNTVWAVPYDGSGTNATIRDIAKTTNGGATWKASKITATGLAATHGLANLSAIDGDTAYAAVYPAGSSVAPQGVYKTIDGGTTWKKVSTGAFTNASSSFINVVHFFNAKNGVAMGDPAAGYFEIYTTDNYGATWVRVADSSIGLTPVAGEYGTVGYYGDFDSTIIYPTNFGNILVSKDLGHTWTLGTSPLMGIGNTSIPSITCSSKNDFWAVLNNTDSASSTLIFSIDGGISWNSSGADTLGNLVYFSSIEHVPGTPATYFLTSANSTSGAVGSAYTEDGVTWVNIDAVQHTACQFADINNGWSGGFNTAITASGGIFKWGSVRVASGVASNKVENFEVYPNPSNGTYYVKATVKGASSIKVMDVTGRVVFAKEYPTQSLLYTSFDLSNQAQGVYMVEVREGNNVSVQKIVKQ